MSIFVWRRWEITNYFVDIWTDPTPVPYVLKGLFSAMWYPGEVKEATCQRTFTRYKLNESGDTIINSGKNLGHLYHHDIDELCPFTTCTCGIYGYHRDYMLGTNTPGYIVTGVAEIWGKIIVAEYGYRAQFAKMRALIDAPKASANYGVPNLPSIDYARREYFDHE